jgi:quinohemoprotein ethanol dehydrogenase
LRDAGKSGEEWISYNVNWSEQRYSALKQIDATNVSRLGIGWYMDIPAAPGNRKTVKRELLWFSTACCTASRHGAWCMPLMPVRGRNCGTRIRKFISRCGSPGSVAASPTVVSRFTKGRLSLPSWTAAFARSTRKRARSYGRRVYHPKRCHTPSLWRLGVIKGGKVIIVVSGGEYGVRGFFSAFDAETGKLAWQF